MILLGQGGQENCPPPTAPTSQPESSPRKGAVSDYTGTTAMSQDSCGKQGALVPLLTAVITKESQSPPHRAPPASESSPIPGCLSQSTFQTARRDAPCGQQVCPFCLKCIPRTWSRMVPGCGRCSVNACGIHERVRVSTQDEALCRACSRGDSCFNIIITSNKPCISSLWVFLHTPLNSLMKTVV